MSLTIFVNSDNCITWDAMTNVKTGLFVNTATVRATLKDADEDNVVGAVNIPMAFVAGSDGKYQGTLQQTVALVVNRFYVWRLTATFGSIVAVRNIPVRAVWKGTDN